MHRGRLIEETMTNFGYEDEDGAWSTPRDFYSNKSDQPRMARDSAVLPGERLWYNSAEGKAQVWYSYGADDTVDRPLVQNAMNLWSRNTCVAFTRMSDDECKRAGPLNHGMINIQAYRKGCCHSKVGDQWRPPTNKQSPKHTRGATSTHTANGKVKKCQDMCLSRVGCNLGQIQRLMGFVLGLIGPNNRPDRDHYVTFHPERVDSDLWPPVDASSRIQWQTLQKCPEGFNLVGLSVPYDFFSIQHPWTSILSPASEKQAVFVTRERSRQYMLDFHWSSCPAQSHLDRYQINKAYHCDTKLAKDCVDSGKTPPKCSNYGYLKRDCTCMCPAGYTGATCQTKSGKTDSCFDSHRSLRVVVPGTYRTGDLGLHVDPTIPDGTARFAQYLSIVADMGSTHKHVNVVLIHAAVHTVMRHLDPWQSSMTILDCTTTVLFWGVSRQRHVRTECFSSLALNEPEPLVLRSRLPSAVDLTFQTTMGQMVRRPQLSVEMLQFQLEFTMFDVMNRTTALADAANGTGFGNGGGGGGGGGSGRGEALGQRAIPGGASGILGALLIGFVMLAVIGVVAFWFWYQRVRYDDWSASEEEEEELEQEQEQEQEEEQEQELEQEQEQGVKVVKKRKWGRRRDSESDDNSDD